MFRNQLYVQSTTCVIMYIVYLFFPEKDFITKIFEKSNGF